MGRSTTEYKFNLHYGWCHVVLSTIKTTIFEYIFVLAIGKYRTIMNLFFFFLHLHDTLPQISVTSGLEEYTTSETETQCMHWRVQGGALGSEAPHTHGPPKKKEEERKKERKKESKQANDYEKYLSPPPPLNEFKVFYHRPILRTCKDMPQQI